MFQEQKPKPSNLAAARLILAAVIVFTVCLSIVLGVAGYLKGGKGINISNLRQQDLALFEPTDEERKARGSAEMVEHLVPEVVKYYDNLKGGINSETGYMATIGLDRKEGDYYIVHFYEYDMDKSAYHKEKPISVYYWVDVNAGIIKDELGNIIYQKNTCGISTVSDMDNNIYNTVKIGEQCWMKENLKVTKNPAGQEIIRYCYDNDSKICETDGGLYDWNTAMNNSIIEGAQGICSNGWHVPKDSDWYNLENYLKDDGETCLSFRNGQGGCATAGIKLGPCGSSGFEGIGSGERYSTGPFYGRKMADNFWSSTEDAEYRSNAWSRYIFLRDAGGSVSRTLIDKANGYSLRCLKD